MSDLGSQDRVFRPLDEVAAMPWSLAAAVVVTAALAIALALNTVESVLASENECRPAQTVASQQDHKEVTR